MCIVRTRCAQCPCRGHCCAYSKLVARMSRAQLVQVAHSACAGRAHSAQVVGACRDLSPLPNPRLGRDIVLRSRSPGDYPMSRHQFHVATSFPPTVGFPGRDTKNPGRDLPHCHPCRDLKNDVATSSPA